MFGYCYFYYSDLRVASVPRPSRRLLESLSRSTTLVSLMTSTLTKEYVKKLLSFLANVLEIKSLGMKLILFVCFLV